MNKILIINGPNLNLTGFREKHIYGDKTWDEIEKELKEYARAKGFILECYQSNSEGSIIDKIQECISPDYAGLIINPGAYTHYSIAIMDALACVDLPVIEVHISNIFCRESFRHNMVTTRGADAVMAGFGPKVYFVALSSLFFLLDSKKEGTDVE